MFYRTLFGFSKNGVKFLVDLAAPVLASSERNNVVFLTPIQKICIFLDFLRTNSFHRTIGTQSHNRISQSTCCKVVNAVSQIFANLQPEFVKWPTVEESSHISTEFFQKTGMPFVQGLIDGTHIEILKPVKTNPPAESYFNRKGYYSLNCLMVCDHLKRIRHFTARHVGSTHDSRIFNESYLRANLEANFDQNNPKVLLGDEGFPCSHILLTPIRQDRIQNENQRRYNIAHKRTRIIVEHTFGMLKKRFPALLYSLRPRKMSNIQAIIAAAVVLHNIVIFLREEPAVLPPTIIEPEFRARLQFGQIALRNHGRPNERNFELRNRIIENYF